MSMDNTSYENMTDHRLLYLYEKEGADREAIKKEWQMRHGWPYPNSQDCTGAVINRLTGSRVL